MKSQQDGELHLLIDWTQPDDSPRWVRAAVGTALVHAVVFLAVLALPNILTYTPAPIPEEQPRKVTHLIAPRMMTQKAPNRKEVAKEVNLESLLPKPASPAKQARGSFHPPPVPASSGPKRTTTAAPNVAEPPKLDAALRTAPNLPQGLSPVAPPPQPPVEEKPKLTFETPGSSAGVKPGATQPAKLAPPKTSVEDAMKSAVRGAGKSGVAVGDAMEEPSIASGINRPGAAGRNRSQLELLSDPQGVDFKPYLIRVLAAVRRNWFAVIPESVHLGRRGRVQVQFSIDRQGGVPKLVIVMPSGAEALDRAAVAGISASNPFPPLPAEFKGDQIRLQLAFQYNSP